jgi:F-type H+-transporting ATPase subunit delta
MKETLRGYAAAVVDGLAGTDRAHTVAREVSSFVSALGSDDGLRQALTDSSIPVATRQGIVSDLLEGRADPDTTRLCAYAVRTERPSELVGALEWLVRRVASEAERAAGSEPTVEPLAHRLAVHERLDGYATATFEREPARRTVEETEDELFRFARIVEGSHQLRSTLTDLDIPVVVRLGVVEDLLGARAQAATVSLASYAIRAGRARDLVGLLDWLVERAAAERNLRLAEVRSAVELDEDQRRRLAEALGRLTGREVELRVVVDPSLIGGLVALVGDTIIDGSIRNRLEQIRAGLSVASATDEQTGDRS